MIPLAAKGVLKETSDIDLLPLRMLVARSRGSKDLSRLALVIEGGGMSGVVSGGMSLVLEDLGLIKYFDFIIGCSAGSLNASYIASRRARFHAPLYMEVASEKGFIDKKRALRGKPIMNLDILFDRHMTNRRPYGDRVMEYRNKLYLLALNLQDCNLEAISDFQSPDEIRLATKASCTILGITGRAVGLRDSLYADGGLIESIPYKTAISLGATHCLVLRSRRESYRKPPFTLAEKALGKILLRSLDGQIKNLVRERNDAYNRDAGELEKMGSQSPVRQICPAEGGFLPDTFESSPDNLLKGFAAGVKAMENHLIIEEEGVII